MAEMVKVAEKAERDYVVWSPERRTQVNLRVEASKAPGDIKPGTDIF
jgi:hypothetical protein